MRRTFGTLLLVTSLSCATRWASAEMPEWRPVTRDELAMRSESKAPGAPAIILFMQVERDERFEREDRYTQIKILTEEGRSAANIQISYDRTDEQLRDIEARTIRKDGTIVPYTGEIFEKPLSSSSDRKILAKTIPLAEAEVGSIVEYRYSRRFRDGTYSLRWLLTNPLFTREAHYSFKAYGPTRYSAPRGLPKGAEPIVFDKAHDRVELTTHDVAAYVSEDYSPPEVEVRPHLDFIHAWDWRNPTQDPEKFWKHYADRQREDTREFLLGSRSLEEAVLQLAPASEAPEIRLRKIFDACASLRNRSYEPERSDDEVERDKLSNARDVRDVWKRKYGWSREIDLLFMAMAREAGFTVAEVWIADREKAFFDPLQMNPSPLKWLYIGVTLNGSEQYFSPGTRFLPYGSIAWGGTQVKALRIDDKKHAWIKTPGPRPDEARNRRVARLVLGPDGVLTGKVAVTHSGREAWWRRNREHNEDAVHKRKFLEEDLTEALSGEANAKVLTEPDWEGSGDFVVEYELTLPDRVISAGSRRLFPAGWFVANVTTAFRRPERVNPIYFWYPWDNEEDIEIELPDGWAVDALPEARHVDQQVLAYSMKVGADGKAVRIKRHMRVDLVLTTADSYAAIRKFYEDVRAGDGQQVVLKKSN